MPTASLNGVEHRIVHRDAELMTLHLELEARRGRPPDQQQG
jgi:hypothetical protein